MLTRVLSPARLLALSLVLALLGLAQARASSDGGQAGGPTAAAGRSTPPIPAAPLP